MTEISFLRTFHFAVLPFFALLAIPLATFWLPIFLITLPYQLQVAKIQAIKCEQSKHRRAKEHKRIKTKKAPGKKEKKAALSSPANKA
jgi:hypothetical protein